MGSSKLLSKIKDKESQKIYLWKDKNILFYLNTAIINVSKVVIFI